MRLFPLMPVIFILAYIFVCISITVNTPFIALTGTAVLAVSLLLYFVITKLMRNHVPAE
jgi:basic amino acid/polyamine antiporter, APA family